MVHMNAPSSKEIIIGMQAIIDSQHGILDETAPGSGAAAYEEILEQPEKYRLMRTSAACWLTVGGKGVKW